MMGVRTLALTSLLVGFVSCKQAFPYFYIQLDEEVVKTGLPPNGDYEI